MISIDIDKCVWVANSKTLIVSKTSLNGKYTSSPTHTFPLMISIVAAATIQFFWDAERRIYKFDKVLARDPSKYFYEYEVRDILIVVV